MKIIHYIKLHNFKVFGEEKMIELDQPSVLIGPNNSGKTSILQALALWSIGLKRWYESKGDTKAVKNITTGINRLDIIQVPVQEVRNFWKNTEIRKGTQNYIPLEISVGVEFNGEVHDCKLVFTHFTPELIYCAPEKNFYSNKELLKYAASLNIGLLYPMSGMITDETLLPDGRINVLIGQGRTAEVLRNLCFQIYEKEKDLWNEVCNLMLRLFNISLLKPTFIESRGTVELKYSAPEVKNPLDISLAGRGQQQMLLLIAYMYAHPNSIILLDEPDAHLEILRQKTVFNILKELSSKNNNQVIMATHSEVILDEASETNLVLIIDGEPINLALKKSIRPALLNFGIEHYYKAKLKKNILYIEGSTDIQILKEFAKLLEDEKSFEILDGVINYYYVQNNENELTQNFPNDSSQGYFKYYKEHFFAIQSVVPEFKGLALFDSDGKGRSNEEINSLYTYYWPLYELENYFVSSQVILNFIQDRVSKQHGPLFVQTQLEKVQTAMDQAMLKMLFNESEKALSDYKKLPFSLQEIFWVNNTKSIKLSIFLELVFTTYSSIDKSPVVLNKGRYYELVKFVNKESVSPDIKLALELINKYIS